jgi:hypothetical protein
VPRSLRELYQDNVDLASEFVPDSEFAPEEVQLKESLLPLIASGLIAGGLGYSAYKQGKIIGGAQGAANGRQIGEKIGQSIGEKVGGGGMGLAVGSISWALFYHLLNKNKKPPTKMDLIRIMSDRVDHLENQLNQRRDIQPSELSQIHEEIRQLEEEIANVSRLSEGVISSVRSFVNRKGAFVNKAGSDAGSYIYKNTPTLRKFGSNVVSGAKNAAGKALKAGFNTTKNAAGYVAKKAVNKVIAQPAKKAGTAVATAAAQDAKSIGSSVKSGFKKLGSGVGKTVNAIMNPASTIADKFVGSSNPAVSKVAKHFSTDNAQKSFSNWTKPKSLATIASIGAADMVVQDSVYRAGKKIYEKGKERQQQNQQAQQQQDQSVQQGQQRQIQPQDQQYEIQPVGSGRKLGDPNRRLRKFGKYE